MGGRWNVVGERNKSGEKLLDSGSDTALWGGLIPELGNKIGEGLPDTVALWFLQQSLTGSKNIIPILHTR